MRTLLMLALFSSFAAAQEPVLRPAQTTDSYVYSVDALRILVNDPAVVAFRLELAWTADDPLQAWLVGMDADHQTRGALIGTFADRPLDTATLAAMPDVSAAELGAQDPDLAMHILHPRVAGAFVADWMTLRHSDDPLTAALSHDGESIRYFTLDKVMITDIVNRAATVQLAVFWGLNTAGKLAPVLAGLDGQGETMIGSTAEAGFALDFTQPCPATCQGGGGLKSP